MILCVCPNPAIDKLIFIENFQKGRVNRVFKEQSFPGGKGVHVAMGIKELGEDVAILAFWGGSTGQWIKKECEAKGILCFGPTLEEWSRTCLTIKSDNEFNETEILGTGPSIDDAVYNIFLKDYENLLNTAHLVCMSGSWPMGNSFKADFSNLIDMATHLNIKSIIDCSGISLVNALKKSPFGVHINHHEGFEIYKTYDSVELSLKLGKNSPLTVVSVGSEGLFLSDGKHVIHALSKVQNVISTVGCGDSLMAGLSVAFSKGYNLEETARLAAACGAANCMRQELGMFFKKMLGF